MPPSDCSPPIFRSGAPLRSLQHLRQILQLAVIRQIDLHGNHRHVLVGQRPFVGVGGFRLAVDEFAREPEILPAPGVFVAVELFAPETAVLAAEFHSLEFPDAADRNVHVQAQRQFDLRGEDLADDPPAVDHRSGEIGVGPVVVERQPDGRTAVEAAFDGGAHRPGVENVDGRIGAVVHARDHHVHALVAQQVVEGHFDAVDRRSRKRVNRDALLLADAAQVKRIVHRDGLAHAALRRLGSHDHHAAEGPGDLYGGLHAFRIVSVVVGYEYQSFIHLSNRFPAKIRIISRFFHAIVAPFGKFFLYLQSLSGVYQPLPLGATADADGYGGRKANASDAAQTNSRDYRQRTCMVAPAQRECRMRNTKIVATMNKDAIIKLVNEQMWPKTDADVPSFKAGDTITVSYKIVEGNKERVQSFRGVVIQIKGSGKTKMFTIRKISNGVGVERIFPLYSPHIDKIEVNKIGVVRRARIYYLRDLTGKKARIKEKRMTRTEKK
nr:MAG TPA: Ribosomal protein L19 [Caudoviricetes sp.]